MDRVKYCSICKTTEGSFIKNSVGKTGIQYHHCTECARKRMKKYRDTPNGKEAVRTITDRYEEKNRIKQRAWSAVNEAVKTGKIKRQPCSVCGDEKSQAHHTDYNKPLEVNWLCAKHHREIHK